jgi:hypothetical protein
MYAKKNYIAFVSFLFVFILCNVWAQGPMVPYYYNPRTELSWAECYVYQAGGSRQKIPFLPVISRNFQRAPLGTNNYSQDVHVNGPIVFIGNGIVSENEYSCYVGRRRDYTSGEIDVAGKFVLFCIDFPDSIGKKNEVPLEDRIIQAVHRKAAGIVLFSFMNDYPFLYAQFNSVPDIPRIPVITVTKQSVVDILLSAGEDGNALFKEWEETCSPPMSKELISKLELKMEGNFDRVESEHFLFRFRGETIPKDEMKALVQTNEKAVKFIFDYFKALEAPKWEKKLNVYFRDFDSKIFYTHHWGWGLASDEGVFMVHLGGAPNFGMAVHENTHIYTYLNWSGESTSFMSEGIAKHVEALANDKDKNHRATVEFLKKEDLFSLEELLSHYIGMPGAKTTVGYPASGSFCGFLIETYGMKSFKEAHVFEDRSEEEKEKEATWIKVFGKSVVDLEQEWLTWLSDKYQVDKKVLDAHFRRIEERRRLQEEAEAQKPKPEEWPLYVGTYEWKEMGRTFEIRTERDELIMTSADMQDLKIQLIPAERHGFRMKGGPMEGQILIFEFNTEGKVERATLGNFSFVRK